MSRRPMGVLVVVEKAEGGGLVVRDYVNKMCFRKKMLCGGIG